MQQEQQKLYDNLMEVLKTKQNPLIEGPNPVNDISYKYIQQENQIKLIEKGIPIVDFYRGAYNNRNLDYEYKLIRKLTESQENCDSLKEYHPDLNKHNRYNNILPYVSTGVEVFQFENELQQQSNTYINGNFIKSPVGDDRLFIATQGPLPQTISNFWKMAWQHDVSLVVMLCNLTEKNKSQCEQYWPDTKLEFPTFSESKELKVTLNNEKDIGNKLIERNFTIEKLQNNQWEKRQIRQLQWMGWPDFGVPTKEDYNIVNNLLNKMIDNYTNQQKQKMVVHCSAGVGRTGTLIALFNLNQEELKNYKVSVFGEVRRMREQRQLCVMTNEQYAYIYDFMSQLIEKNI